MMNLLKLCLPKRYWNEIYRQKLVKYPHLPIFYMRLMLQDMTLWHLFKAISHFPCWKNIRNFKSPTFLSLLGIFQAINQPPINNHNNPFICSMHSKWRKPISGPCVYMCFRGYFTLQELTPHHWPCF